MKKYLICLFISISIFTYIFTKNTNLDQFFIDAIPQSFIAILLHNLKVSLIYRIPILGPVHFYFSILIIFISIGLSFSHLGILFSLARLLHLPLELYAFNLSVKTKFIDFKHELKLFSLITILLFIAALLEFYIWEVL